MTIVTQTKQVVCCNFCLRESRDVSMYSFLVEEKEIIGDGQLEKHQAHICKDCWMAVQKPVSPEPNEDAKDLLIATITHARTFSEVEHAICEYETPGACGPTRAEQCIEALKDIMRRPGSPKLNRMYQDMEAVVLQYQNKKGE